MRANECSSALECSVMETEFFFPMLLAHARVVSERGENFARAGPSGTEANEE